MRRRQIILACAFTAAAVLGCSGDVVYFDISLLGPMPAENCPAGDSFSRYAVLIYEDTAPLSCVEGACTGRDSPRQCLAGVETPELRSGSEYRIKVMLFDTESASRPVLCGELPPTRLSSEDPDAESVPMHCEENCSGMRAGYCLDRCAMEYEQRCPQ